MALDWFGRSKQANIQGLIAQKNYGAAIAQIRAQLEKRKGDERMQVRLADVLVQAGRTDEAVGILMPLADDLALRGLAAKSISILKRVHQLRPRDPEVEEKLAYMIRQQLNPSVGPWQKRASEPKTDSGLEIGMEEITDDSISMLAIEEPEAVDEPSAPAPLEPVVPPAAPEPEVAAEESPDPEEADADAGDAGSFAFDEAFRDQLASMLEDVLVQGEGDASQAEAAAGGPMIDTPLFKDFSQDELVAVIRGLQLRIYEPGEIIMSAGEPGESLFILTSGRVLAYMRTQDGSHQRLRQMREGDFFGEISVLTGNPRSATVTAASNCDLLELKRKSLEEISKTHPHVREVLQQFYAERASHSVKTAREKK
jgi:hypothetical protein